MDALPWPRLHGAASLHHLLGSLTTECLIKLVYNVNPYSLLPLVCYASIIETGSEHTLLFPAQLREGQGLLFTTIFRSCSLYFWSGLGDHLEWRQRQRSSKESAGSEWVRSGVSDIPLTSVLLSAWTHLSTNRKEGWTDGWAVALTARTEPRPADYTAGNFDRFSAEGWKIIIT